MKPVRISLYGHFGAGNLGNECTLQAVIEQTLRHRPNAQMLCFCTNPKYVQTYIAGGEQAYQAQNGGADSMGVLPLPVF